MIRQELGATEAEQLQTIAGMLAEIASVEAVREEARRQAPAAGEALAPRKVLAANIKAAAHALAIRKGIEPSGIWIALAKEHWPDSAGPERSRMLRQYARGLKWPTDATLEKLAEVLEVQWWELLQPTGNS